jgi:hypothetical protein
MIYNKQQLYPGIWRYPDVFKKDLNLIERIEKEVSLDNTKWNKAQVSLEETDLNYRDCQDFKLSALGKEHDLYKDIYNCQKDPVEDFCNMYSIKMDFWEWTNIIKYYPNQFFEEHADDGWSYKCAVSLVGYPNDGYTGGGLYFPKFDLLVEPKLGDLIIFPSSFIYSHVALPVESGIKYCFVTMLDYNDDAHTEEYDKYIDIKYKKEREYYAT